MMKQGLVWWFLIVLGIAGGCERKPAEEQAAAGSKTAGEKIQAFVGILPMADFVQRIGGQHVEVEVLVGPGKSPHTFAPTPQQMAALERCEAYFSLGLPFEERLIAKIAASMPTLNVVDCREGLELRMMEAGEAHHHEEGEEHEHEQAETQAHKEDHGPTLSAAEMDPHVWLDPKRVKIIAETICGELCRLDPARRPEYQANLLNFVTELNELDARITNTLAPLKGREFFVFHPAFGYFGDSYGLKQVPVEIEGKDPTPQQIATLIEKAKKEGVKVIFVQPQFSLHIAQAIAKEIGGAVAPLDDLPENYIQSMDEMAKKLADALGEQTP